MKQVFVFNDCGMCEDPERIVVYKSGHDSAEVRLAQISAGQWCIGYDFQCGNGGSSCAPGFNKDRTTLYPTRADALMAVLDRGINWASQFERWPEPERSQHRRFTQGLIAYKASQSQLTLF